MDEVVVVHVLSVEQVTILPLAQVLGVDAVGPEKLLVGDAKGLTDRLSDQLGLREGGSEGGQELLSDTRLVHIPQQGRHSITILVRTLSDMTIIQS